jgi:class 3 adenylate cyclase
MELGRMTWRALRGSAAGYGYLLKDQIADGDELVNPVRSVATGGTTLNSAAVDALLRRVNHGGLSAAEESLLGMIAEGKPIKAIAAVQHSTPKHVGAQVEALFMAIAEGVADRAASTLRQLRLLHRVIVDREEQSETVPRLFPGGLAEELRHDDRYIGETEVVEVTVLMSDISSYSTIAEHAELTQLARQLNTHRPAMNEAIIGEGGTVMQFWGDAVMAAFGAPFSQADHTDRAVAAARAAHLRQAKVNPMWAPEGLPPFGLGFGLSTGEAAAAMLGPEERLEYALVGDTVNLAQRLQQLAEAGETVLSQATLDALSQPMHAAPLPEQLVMGRDTPVRAYKIGCGAR